ncbi:hypothetical protein EMIHUDRAFT_252428 [Emiliania huxleyi CCMP1516]|uniref:tRNA:m(4)X modification enzyme TRM13 n=2 Tax=Emiliania huxleyi TaxID=2903 RepID=A0A0D3KK30_EMIH1|nr:hypothetical protein EMIHUDRAFT_252428 [Emiliania huxleyi CCMP1516]EOD36115.1 hypothetical protein EMIHUDRAFT_252428 [Emiliania huxleyi CCMP1516]|eukprot:XP_005788544.1 hypothetical protein EMIHUDRAFT_252428 [Emiliania huxleyi CCMP1516]
MQLAAFFFRATPAPALVQPALVQCPTPGCNTPLRPGRVAAHLLRCPVLAEIRRQEAQTWFVRGVNTGEGDEGEPDEPLTMEAASLLEASLERRSGTLWHAPASSALPDGLGLGAGNGELSLALAEAHRDAVRSDTLVLLDQGSKPKGRSGHGRLAADTALEGHFASVTRLKASLESTGWPLVAASVAASADPLELLLATCCHHRCSWRDFVNRPSLRSAGLADGFGAAEFERLCRVSSRGVNAQESTADVGRRAKDVLDEARAEYLRSHGFEARLSTFVDASVTPENYDNGPAGEPESRGRRAPGEAWGQLSEEGREMS